MRDYADPLKKFCQLIHEMKNLANDDNFDTALDDYVVKGNIFCSLILRAVDKSGF